MQTIKDSLKTFKLLGLLSIKIYLSRVGGCIESHDDRESKKQSLILYERNKSIFFTENSSVTGEFFSISFNIGI